MSSYSVKLSARAADWLEECLDARLRKRISQTIDALAANPRPPGCVKLLGEDNVWRVRVSDYRIVYEIYDDQLMLLVIRVANRREAYR